MPIQLNSKNALLDDRVVAIRVAHLGAGIKRAELDLSGGIDSAVMACLLVMVLGPENVTLVHSRFSTSHDQSERARDLADALGCPMVDVDLGVMWDVLRYNMNLALKCAGYDLAEIEARCEADPTILGGLRSCLRAPIGRGFNRLTGGGLRHGTGNECEDRWLRFYQKGGDGEVDSNPMAMLSKGEVYQLAWLLARRLPKTRAVMEATIEANPTPDLRPKGTAGYTDEDELLAWTGVPFTYSRIDLKTGEYSYVGTIERVSRFLDLDTSEGGVHVNEEDVFDDGSNLAHPSWDKEMVSRASRSGLFGGFRRSEVGDFLLAARKAERITRHKANPSIPTYGTRADLIAAGILTNDLPEV